MLVLEGDIDIVRDGQVVDTAGPGSYVGESAVLDDVRRNASVVARTPVLVGVIEASLFKALLWEIPELTERVEQAFGRRTPPGTVLP